MPVYRKSAGYEATKNKSKKNKKFLTKTTNANPDIPPMISRHNKGTNVSFNMNGTNKSLMSETMKNCLNHSYSICQQDSNCSWKWTIPNQKGYCK